MTSSLPTKKTLVKEKNKELRLETGLMQSLDVLQRGAVCKHTFNWSETREVPVYSPLNPSFVTLHPWTALLFLSIPLSLSLSFCISAGSTRGRRAAREQRRNKSPNQTEYLISSKISNSWRCYLAGWPGARSGGRVEWRGLTSCLRRGWLQAEEGAERGREREREAEKGRRDRQ